MPAAEPATRKNPETSAPRRGRGLWCCRTTSCWRRQRLSAISSAFGWTAAASAHSRQRSIDLSPCCWTARRLMLFNAVNGNGPCGSQFCAPQVWRDRRRQYARQPWRCQRSTVSGLTTRREVCQPLNQRHAKIQKRQSTSSRRGRGLRRCRTTSCWRSKDCLRSKRTAAASTHSKQRSIASPPVVEPPGG